MNDSDDPNNPGPTDHSNVLLSLGIRQQEAAMEKLTNEVVPRVTLALMYALGCKSEQDISSLGTAARNELVQLARWIVDPDRRPINLHASADPEGLERAWSMFREARGVITNVDRDALTLAWVCLERIRAGIDALETKELLAQMNGDNAPKIEPEEIQ